MAGANKSNSAKAKKRKIQSEAKAINDKKNKRIKWEAR
jgi:hypothetical protein